jgi:hypothetical protein
MWRLRLIYSLLACVEKHSKPPKFFITFRDFTAIKNGERFGRCNKPFRRDFLPYWLAAFFLAVINDVLCCLDAERGVGF